MTDFADKSIEILELSDDGDNLTPNDLSLVQLAVNEQLNEAGVAAFEKLYADVVSGEYFTRVRWFHGIEHMTKDHEGYVYWKGVSIEHYSHDSVEESRRDALALADKCRALEAKGFPVTGRSVLSECMLEAPADTPWLLALQRYYAFFQNAAGEVVGIFYCLTDTKNEEPRAACIRKVEGKLDVEFFDWAYTAFHAIQNRGYESMGVHPRYIEVCRRMALVGVTPEELERVLKTPK
ncbi:hypothetical protein F6X40_27855 [Paraburkholderia sp. UCT31]|uniref:hypothetical protein n=1 Tax=Paraburkholderia sp. UCT31 TaxID=2615209 RepID=UPI001655C907|nr:hypothetical protein [Paraburkholderia sp. UCT31]MBC8740455.1 hypothetical protein [Paraburkholderia sp. UCT31]